MRDWGFAFLILFYSLSSFAEAQGTKPYPCQNAKVEDLRVQMGLSSAEIPTPLQKPKYVAPIGCERPFVYRGEVYAVDAPQAQDASTLRQFLQPVPEADSIIQSYQERRERSKISAYTGTLGIFAILVANTVIRRMHFDSKDSVVSALQIGGLALTVGGFAYSFALLKSNEYLLPKAVDAYNRAKPEDPIELRFQAGWSF